MNIYQFYRLRSAIFLILSLLLPFNLVAKDSLTLGIHPFLADEVLIKKFSPLAKYLNSQTGLNIIIKVGSSYDEHIHYAGSDKLDIAYMGPASYIHMVNKYGNKPILAKLEVKGISYFQGNIIARKESGIKSLEDLVGKRIAFGDPNSTMSYIVPHHVMHQAGVFKNNTTEHQFLHSHNNVALAVLSGDFDAGAVKPAVFQKFKDKGLRTIAVTPKISEHLFITRVDLPEKTIAILRSAMLNITDTALGVSTLKKIKNSITNLVEARQEDYTNLRKIILESQELH